MIPAAIGLKAKTGRAIAVVLSGPTDAPQLIKRTELILTDPRVPATFQPYHKVMDLPWSESEKRVVPFVRAIEKIAAKTLAELVHELKSQGMGVVGVGISGAADRDLSKIGNYHIRAHAVEGLLFPDTYRFGKNDREIDVVRTLVKRFDAVADSVPAPSSAGVIPPVGFCGEVRTTILVRGDRSFSNSSMRKLPSSSTGANLSTAPCRSRRKCHGTMLEWCSMIESTISSPGLMRSRPNV